MNYAIIENSLVVNICVLSSKSVEDFPTAVSLEGRLVQIGDTYQDGKFYRDGVEVLTESEEKNLRLRDALLALETLGYTEEV